MPLQLRKGFFGAGSVEVSPAADGEGPIRRFAPHADKPLMTSPREDVTTVPDIIAYASRTYKDMNAVGWRDIIKVHEEKKQIKTTVDGKEVTKDKVWKYFELSEYKFLSYTEFEKQIGEVGAGLAALGVKEGDVFNIFAQTSVQWQLMSHGCALISATIATAYDTLGPSGLTHSLNEPKCVGIFTNPDLLSTVLEVLPNTHTIKYVIYDGEPSPATVNKIRAVRDSVDVLHIDELKSKGREYKDDISSRRPKPETLACIMYTSGSTGPPKGVCITHGNLLASVGSISYVFEPHLPAGSTYLAYLPLAHVLEYIVELAAVYVGITCGYARPKTLTDASVRGCKGDLTELRPHIMFGVPTVWETIRKGIVGQVQKGGWITQQAFALAMGLKRWNVPILAGLADSVVLSKVKAATGGRLMFGMNGGASISQDTQELMSLAVMPMMQGYGMTESCGMCALLPPELMRYNSVGIPVPSVEIKLLDVPEAGYVSSDPSKPQQGEVTIRGPSVTKGYYKRPDLNEDETIFTKDGWLRTGDVGQWNEDGTLSLIDRVKNLIKLSNGEYIALERLESIYKSNSFVANLCVYASAEANQPIGIIVPHESNLRHALEAHAHINADPHTSLAELCENKDVRKLVLKECEALAKKNGFKPTETLCAVILTPEEWTPENGLVTPAQKVNRGAVAKKFSAEIKDAYKGH